MIAYFLGLGLYISSVFLSYSAQTKVSNWYYPTGLAIALCANFLWLYLAKTSTGPNDTYIKGLIWDSMIVGCYAFVPLMFGVKLSGWTLAGVVMVVIGLLLTKLGG